MQRSHWHLMSQHFSQKTGVWNQYCHYRFRALHRCPAKTMEAPWRGYTPPKRWSRLVKITCGLHHMRLGSTKISSGAIHTMNSWSALAGSGYKKVLPSHHGPKAKTSRTWQCQPPKHRSALMGPALRKCSSWGKKSKTPGESSSKAIHDPTVPTRIGLMHHVSTLRGKSKPSYHTTEDMLQCWPHWSVVRTASVVFTIASFTQHAIKHDLSVFGD